MTGYERIVAALARVTSSGRYIPEIDGLRFVAIAGVVLHHMRANLEMRPPVAWNVPTADDLLARVAFQGDAGVLLFFAISGFVLGLPFVLEHAHGGAPVSLRAYYVRRLTRLEPPYLASLIAIAMLLVVFKHRADLLPHALASSVYVHNLVYQRPSLVNVVYWSLEVEVQFYVVAPFLAKGFLRFARTGRRVLLLLIVCGTVAVQQAARSPHAMLELTLAGNIQHFLVGLLLADLYADEWRGVPGGARAWDAVALLGWPLLVVALVTYPVAARGLVPFFTLVLYVAVFRGELARRVFAATPIRTIGGMCYSIYLIHFQVISVGATLTTQVTLTHDFGVNLLLQIVLTGIPVLVASAIFFLLVEKPCMRSDWPSRLAAALWSRHARATPRP